MNLKKLYIESLENQLSDQKKMVDAGRLDLWDAKLDEYIQSLKADFKKNVDFDSFYRWTGGK